MGLKILGSILIVLSSSLIGFYFGNKYSARLENLLHLEQCIKILETEIVYGAVPLPEALNNVYLKGNKKVSYIFKQIRDNLLYNKDGDLLKSFEMVTSQLAEELNLKEEDIELFLSLGRLLGTSDRTDQEKNFKLILNQIEILKNEAKLEKDKNEKMYKNLGILAGIAIVIILL
jgi:stage III sporulation protein AB